MYEKAQIRTNICDVDDIKYTFTVRMAPLRKNEWILNEKYQTCDILTVSWNKNPIL